MRYFTRGHIKDQSVELKTVKMQHQAWGGNATSSAMCVLFLQSPSFVRTGYILDQWFLRLTLPYWEHPPIDHAVTCFASLHTACRHSHCCFHSSTSSHTPSISLSSFTLNRQTLKKYIKKLLLTWQSVWFLLLKEKVHSVVVHKIWSKRTHRKMILV